MNRFMDERRTIVLLALGLFGMIGCSGPRDPVPVSFDPATASRAAVDGLDTDRDGALSAAEWRRSPGLAAAAPRIDTTKDGRISAHELETRLEAYRAHPPYLVLMVHVQRQGQPVPDATVRIVPESFMGEGFSRYEGTTDAAGRVSVVRSDGSLRDTLPPGLYVAEVTASGTTTRQGLEVTADTPGGRGIILQIP
jgi:hypothetical protein